MRNSLSLGRIFGIEIRIDWSWLLIFVLMSWNLASSFSWSYQTWDAVLIWGTAITATLLFFVSILLHELAHSLVAKAYGIPIHDITLFLFGGVANIQREPPSARSEFLIAIVGPITSLLIGGILLGFVGITSPNVRTGVAEDVFVYARLTILDCSTDCLCRGGATVKYLSHNSSFCFWETVPLYFETKHLMANLHWLVSEQCHPTKLPAAYYTRCSSWCSCSTVDATESTLCRCRDCAVSELVYDCAMKTDDYAFPVFAGEDFVGIVTLDDVRSVKRDSWDTSLVSNIMTPTDKLIITTADEDATNALDKLAQHDVRQLPVMQGNQLIGLLRRQDIVKWLQLQADLSADKARKPSKQS